MDEDSIIHSAVPPGFPRTKVGLEAVGVSGTCGGDNLFP